MQPDKKNALTTVFAMVAGTVIVSVAVKKASHGHPPCPEKILARTSSKLNQTLPKMVDHITRLDTTVQRPGRIFSYKYTLLGRKAAHLNKERIKASIAPTLIQNYKTNPAMAGLRGLSTVLKYAYFDEAGAFIFDLEIDPKTF